MASSRLSKSKAKTKEVAQSMSDISQSKLEAYAHEIKGLLRSTLHSAVRIGEILKDVRDNVLPYGEWMQWVDKEFDTSITANTATNFINLYDLYNKYSDEYPKGLETLSLSSLYIISRHSVDSEVQRAVLEIAEEQSELPPSREEVRSIVQSFRLIKMEEAGLSEEVQNDLVDLDIVENPKEVKALQKLSKRKQSEVASLLNQGVVGSTKEAIKHIQEQKKSERDKSDSPTIEVAYERCRKERFTSLGSIPSESVNLAFAEAPLKANYVTTSLHTLCKEIERILVPSGYAIITLGHKAAMFAGPEIEPLKPIHLLCLRRQPGNTRSIIGTNIMSASVFAAFCYKAPYAAPKAMLADLHTYNISTESEALQGMDEVYTGLEKCIERLFTPLVHSGETVLHAVIGGLHFNLSEHIYDVSSALDAAAVYSFKGSVD